MHFSDFLRNDGSNNLSSIFSLARFAKGSCHTMGIFKVEGAAEEIQWAAADSSRDCEENIQLITRLLGEMRDSFVDADDKLRAFYRESQRVIEW
jgi:hypothetical protein